MYETSDKVVNVIEETMKNWRVELTVRRKSFVEAKIQRAIFQGDALSPLLFLIAMVPLKHRLRKCKSGYKPSKSQENTSHQMYMYDITLFTTEKTGNLSIGRSCL